ncbi:MAG: hypothetical protein NUV57_05455 [archaeon]|nr:hypothetical protein [archaeon]
MARRKGDGRRVALGRPLSRTIRTSSTKRVIPPPVIKKPERDQNKAHTLATREELNFPEDRPKRYYFNETFGKWQPNRRAITSRAGRELRLDGVTEKMPARNLFADKGINARGTGTRKSRKNMQNRNSVRDEQVEQLKRSLGSERFNNFLKAISSERLAHNVIRLIGVKEIGIFLSAIGAKEAGKFFYQASERKKSKAVAVFITGVGGIAATGYLKRVKLDGFFKILTEKSMADLINDVNSNFRTGNPP